MKFKISSTFNYDVKTIETASYDEKLVPFLIEKMPSLKEMELLEVEKGEREIRRKVRYLPHPLIKKIGTKKISPEAMEWIEESVYDIDKKVLKYNNISTHHRLKNKVVNTGEISLTEKDGKTIREMNGELKIQFPIIGKIAERVVFNIAKKLIAEEEKAFSEFLDKYYK